MSYDTVSTVAESEQLPLLVVGAHLYSKKGSKASVWALTWLFSYRYLVLSLRVDLDEIAG